MCPEGARANATFCFRALISKKRGEEIANQFQSFRFQKNYLSANIFFAAIKLELWLLFLIELQFYCFNFKMDFCETPIPEIIRDYKFIKELQHGAQGICCVYENQKDVLKSKVVIKMVKQKVKEEQLGESLILYIRFFAMIVWFPNLPLFYIYPPFLSS